MTTQNKKVLLTGATGLIGKELINPLIKNGFEVYALTRNSVDFNTTPNVHWIQIDLFDSVALKNIFEEIKPNYLLNFAWIVTNNYSTNNVNFDFVRVGLELLKYFHENGGTRAIYAGTCFEYEVKESPIDENSTINPQETYGKCKNYLHQLAELYCKNNKISFGWGRIFYVYGINEHKSRLTRSIIDHLNNNEEIIIKHSKLHKDYIYSKDIAKAFVKLLESNVEGSVNICTGKSISIEEYARTIGRHLNKEHLLIFHNEPCSQPPIIVGNNKRLTQEIGYTIQYDLEKAFNEILSTTPQQATGYVKVRNHVKGKNS